MEISLKRTYFTEKSTIGVLTVNHHFECFSLEDKDRQLESGGEKIYGKTAIPRGRYRIIVDLSQRFGRTLPRLLSVPNFEGIRIHAGNTTEDTDGCILTGQTIGFDFVGQSKLALESLMIKIFNALDLKEEVWISIS